MFYLKGDLKVQFGGKGLKLEYCIDVYNILIFVYCWYLVQNIIILTISLDTVM